MKAIPEQLIVLVTPGQVEGPKAELVQPSRTQELRCTATMVGPLMGIGTSRNGLHRLLWYPRNWKSA